MLKTIPKSKKGMFRRELLSKIIHKTSLTLRDSETAMTFW